MVKPISILLRNNESRIRGINNDRVVTIAVIAWTRWQWNQPTGYCHKEPYKNYPAASNYAEKLMGINGVGVTNNALYFVNPWVTC